MANERRLIDANELTVRLNHTTMVAYPNLFPGLLAAVEIVDDSPTVDAVEVVHGRWRPLEYDGYADGNPVWDLWECSECQEEHSGDEDSLTPYCPNCGAKMDGERRTDG